MQLQTSAETGASGIRLFPVGRSTHPPPVAGMWLRGRYTVAGGIGREASMWRSVEPTHREPATAFPGRQ